MRLRPEGIRGGMRHRAAGRGGSVRMALFLGVLLLLSGCDVFENHHDGLLVQSHAGTLLIGDTLRVSAERLDGSSPPPSAIRWRSSDEGIATVDDEGLVTAHRMGPVDISASAYGLTASLFLWIWEPAPPFVTLSVGGAHSCGLDQQGRVWCWGADWDGQLGSPAVPDRCLPSAPLPCATGALPVFTDLRFQALALGDNHSCGLTESGRAYCWGAYAPGPQGGAGSRWAPEAVPGDAAFRSLAAGGAGTCGITGEGELLCWGSGPFGAFKEGARAPATTPERPRPGHRFTTVALAARHACALDTDGAAWCWGQNDHGQLGVGHVDSAEDAQRVESVPPFVALALARDYSCGLAGDGTAYCWGRNDLGQLGDGTTDGRWEPRSVGGGQVFVDLSAGASYACGVGGDGALHCWGRDQAAFGRGVEEDPIQSPEPLEAAPGVAFRSLAVGANHTCGVADTGVTWCWGTNLFGTVGNGRSSRMPVTAPERVVRRTDAP
jgi:alpha-tubulin suppressor-like RCC1 family protein